MVCLRKRFESVSSCHVGIPTKHSSLQPTTSHHHRSIIGHASIIIDALKSAFQRTNTVPTKIFLAKQWRGETIIFCLSPPSVRHNSLYHLAHQIFFVRFLFIKLEPSKVRDQNDAEDLYHNLEAIAYAARVEPAGTRREPIGLLDSSDSDDGLSEELAHVATLASKLQPNKTNRKTTSVTCHTPNNAQVPVPFITINGEDEDMDIDSDDETPPGVKQLFTGPPRRRHTTDDEDSSDDEELPTLMGTHRNESDSESSIDMDSDSDDDTVGNGPPPLIPRSACYQSDDDSSDDGSSNPSIASQSNKKNPPTRHSGAKCQ